MKLLDTLGLSPAAIAARQRSIGGSDANTIMGGNAERLIRLWREKRGEAEPEDLSGNLAVTMGLFTEPLNIAWFEKQTGRSVVRRGEVAGRQWDGHPMAATLDGITGAAVFEAKHCGTRDADAAIFERYVPQLTHNCLCAGLREAALSVFRGNGDWVLFDYALDDDYAAALVEAESAFWRCVQTGEPPAPLPAPAAPKPVGVKVYDMSLSNAWAASVADFIETELAADRHELARKTLKELVPDDASEARGHGLVIKRAKNGALRFIREEQA